MLNKRQQRSDDTQAAGFDYQAGFIGAATGIAAAIAAMTAYRVCSEN